MHDAADGYLLGSIFMLEGSQESCVVLGNDLGTNSAGHLQLFYADHAVGKRIDCLCHVKVFLCP